ncbi:MAG: 8-oxoguanine deaminase [Anaerolineae bacterium]|nr:8-oxoguanine deaminase [Anaerolineae bacterium]MDK1080284.1 8-oxoguanine deaminase [Anaerolineae bacterium]
MATLLGINAKILVTMDENRREIVNGGLFVREGVIEQVGPTTDLPANADTIINLAGHIVLPGLVNTHHHLYQGLTRVIPAGQNSELFDWLKALYPIWAGLTAEAIYVSTLTGLAELILSGCTTASDHLYIYPNDCRLDDEIQAAQEIGIRFHAMRGSMSLGESKGGLPPDSIVEDEEDILHDSRRLIETYHDSERFAMLRVGLAPCSPFSITQDLMRSSAEMARSYGVRLHTHLAENPEDIVYCREKFGMRPGEYAEDVGWVGEDVWHAHCVMLNKEEMRLFARTGTGVCHCPNSNMRTGAGIAPIRKMLDIGIPVGLGVDGAAANDAGHLLAEARQTLLLQRVLGGPSALTAREALEMATLGGARVLGRDDIGTLAPGMAADFIAFDLNQIGFIGTSADLVAALIFCHPINVSYSVINGRLVVEQGHLTTIDLPVILERHNIVSKALINKEL